MLQGVDLGVRHTPVDVNAAVGLAGCVWRKRNVAVLNKASEQFLVMSGDERAVLGSGFTEAAAAYFARKRLEFLARPPESFSACLAGCAFREDRDELGRMVEQQVIDPDGAVIGRSVSGREAACLQAEKTCLSRLPMDELSLDDFSKIAYTVHLRQGFGRQECSTMIDGDERQLRGLIHDVFQLSPQSRQDGEDSNAFIQRVRAQLIRAIDMKGVPLYVGHVSLPELNGRLFLVGHTERLSPQAAIRTAYQAEIDELQEVEPERQRAHVQG